MPTRRTPLSWSLLAAALALSAAAPACHAARGSPAEHGGAGPAAASPARVVRLTRDLGFTGIVWVVDLREYAAVPGRSGAVRGEMRVTTGGGNVGPVEQQFGCRVRPARAAGAEGDGGDGAEPRFTCRVTFAGGTPDWRAALARLDALGVMAPPRDTLAAEQQEVCTDADFWALAVFLDGAPAPAVRDAQVCARRSPRRAAYERGVDSVFNAIVDAGRVARP